MTWFFKADIVTVFFAVAAVGMLLGFIRIKRVGLSVAGVLCVALLCGTVFSDIAKNEEKLLSFCTKLGLSLFVPCVALQAGQGFVSLKKTKVIKAFFSGMTVVSFGGGAILFLSCLFKIIPALSAGLFAGSLTSTPALAAATELFGSAPAVGYGISYCFGLLLIVLFVQVMRKELWEEPETAISAKKKTADPVLSVLIVALFGNLLNRFSPISTTTGILFFGMMMGYLLLKAKRTLPDLSQIRTFGLILFFVGTGISAGSKLKDTVRWEWLLVGFGVSVCAVGIGYLATRFLFRFCRADALAVLCGGMTSTPAISVLKPSSERVPLYTVSYTGALCALLAWIRLFYFLAGRGW